MSKWYSIPLRKERLKEVKGRKVVGLCLLITGQRDRAFWKTLVTYLRMPCPPYISVGKWPGKRVG